MCSENIHINNERCDKRILVCEANRGLDFFVRHQVKNSFDANDGRFLWAYDIQNNKILSLSTNWSTAVIVEALLIGYKSTSQKAYFESAKSGINYIKSLQQLDSREKRTFGTFHEDTPQSDYCCPRDAATAAWALMDWHNITGDKDSLERAILFADWYKTIGMERGFPYWKIYLDSKEWNPKWSGSFQSGTGFFLGRMYEITGDQTYLNCMIKLLKHYNDVHLDNWGNVNVIAEESLTPTSIINDDAPADWQIMHVYNDDFGCLANLFAFKLTKNIEFKNAASRFLIQIQKNQNEDGGFGPLAYSVPSAAGTVIIEALCARRAGLDVVSEDCLNKAVKYILSIQMDKPIEQTDGCFVDKSNFVLARTGAYSIMALYRMAECIDNIYFIDGLVL